jgi:hypothetical protein
MLIFTMNMEEAFISLVCLALVLTSGIEFFDKILKYLERVEPTIVGGHDTVISVSKNGKIGQRFDQCFAKERVVHSLHVDNLEQIQIVQFMVAFRPLEDLVHNTVLQHGHLESVAKDPKVEETAPIKRLVIIGSELACIKPGIEELEYLRISIQQIEPFVGCFYEGSIEGCAEVVAVEYQQVFVDGELLFGGANDDGDNPSSVVLAVARKNREKEGI